LDDSSVATRSTDIEFDPGEAGEVLDAEITETICAAEGEPNVEVLQGRHRTRHKHQLVESAYPE
jgi:hypothetical protein